jgi:glycosyltransferase involved in cell wall biosynthesis
MNVLFDIISAQGYISGGGEYAKRVFLELTRRETVCLYCLYDSKLKFQEDDESFFKEHSVMMLDINQNAISDYVERHAIDVFFIAIAQRFFSYNLNNIRCKTFLVIHDIGDVETFTNDIHYHYKRNIKNWVKNSIIDYSFVFRPISTISRVRRLYKKLIQFLNQGNVQIITVSHYTYNSIRYYFPDLDNKDIDVLYPPERILVESNTCICLHKGVENIINSKITYFLLLNINRANKNAKLVYNVFLRIQEKYPDLFLVTIGNIKFESKNIISFGFLPATDLNLLYKHAQALIYPSFTEGFGYPPLEAMRYGTPVISSNTCSMPEVLGDAATYFSPLFENDLYGKIINHVADKEKIYNRVIDVQKKQSEDLNKLIEKIIS